MSYLAPPRTARRSNSRVVSASALRAAQSTRPPPVSKVGFGEAGRIMRRQNRLSFSHLSEMGQSLRKRSLAPSCPDRSLGAMPCPRFEFELFTLVVRRRLAG